MKTPGRATGCSSTASCCPARPCRSRPAPRPIPERLRSPGSATRPGSEGSSQVLQVADWRQGDYGVNLTNLPPDEDDGDLGGDTDAGRGTSTGTTITTTTACAIATTRTGPATKTPTPTNPTVRDDRFRDGEDQFTRSGLQLADPLVIDLDGDGLELISRDQGVLFDIDGDGVLERVGWVGPDDGFLAVDANNNGRIDGVSELFGTPASSAYAELATYNTHQRRVGLRRGR